MKKTIGPLYKLLFNQNGVALLETVLVLPLYMLIIGGMCYFGDILLKNSRVQRSGRAFGYVAFHRKHWDAFNAALSRFQNEGDIHARAFFTQDDAYVTRTNWGAILNSYAILKNVNAPEGIVGMLLVGEGMYEQDTTLNTQQFDINYGMIHEDEKNAWTRHWLAVRKDDFSNIRPPMGSIANTRKTASDEGNSQGGNEKCIYYAWGENYWNSSLQAYATGWLGMSPENTLELVEGSSSLKASSFYSRKFGAFFSSEDK